MKKISILGSTGSIGTQALDVVRGLPGSLSVAAVAANANIQLLEEQIREFRPAFAAVFDEAAAQKLKLGRWPTARCALARAWRASVRRPPWRRRIWSSIP